MLVNKLETKIHELKLNHVSISKKRKELLDSFTMYIAGKIKRNSKINLIFICTHNSRRSMMGQIWAKTAAEYFKIPKVKCYSGGTEATAFNPHAVKAVRKVGFIVKQKDQSDNPIYLVYYSKNQEPLECFSKVYSDSYNPQKDFAAIMTCSDADTNCPVVFGAKTRFPIRYDDPKEFDGTEFEEQKYDERFEQIGREMIYTFSNLKKY